MSNFNDSVSALQSFLELQTVESIEFRNGVFKTEEHVYSDRARILDEDSKIRITLRNMQGVDQALRVIEYGAHQRVELQLSDVDLPPRELESLIASGVLSQVALFPKAHDEKKKFRPLAEKYGVEFR